MQGAQQVGGGLGYVRMCAWTAGAREKAHKLEERPPCNQGGAGGLRKSRFSRTCERSTKGQEALATGMDLVVVQMTKKLLALAAFLKVRISTCGRQPKVAFSAACAPFFGT